MYYHCVQVFFLILSKKAATARHGPIHQKSVTSKSTAARSTGLRLLCFERRSK